jgi:hypothetical protein
MFYVKSTRFAAVAALGVTLFFASAVLTDAQAGNGGKRQTRASQGNHNTQGNWTRTTTGQRTDTGRQRSTVVTRDDGKVATRDTTVVNDRAAGTRSVDSTATGFNGRTTTYSSDARRTENGYTRDVSRTLPDGQVNSRAIDAACDKAARSCTRTVTGQNGG